MKLFRERSSFLKLVISRHFQSEKISDIAFPWRCNSFRLTRVWKGEGSSRSKYSFVGPSFAFKVSWLLFRDRNSKEVAPWKASSAMYLSPLRFAVTDVRFSRPEKSCLKGELKNFKFGFNSLQPLESGCTACSLEHVRGISKVKR